jgi:hypothetical protein
LDTNVITSVLGVFGFVSINKVTNSTLFYYL